MFKVVFVKYKIFKNVGMKYKPFKVKFNQSSKWNSILRRAKAHSWKEFVYG